MRPATRASIYFVHIPKTAGITLKAYLENQYARGEELVIDEWKARALPPGELGQYRLLSGHYSAEVLAAYGSRPDVILSVFRRPMARFASWSAHARRLTKGPYREMFEGRTDLEVVSGPHGYTCRQAHWLARAVRDGADYTGIPGEDELPALLDQIDLVGLTEEIERFMQLVAFRMGWPPPPRGWHINRRPGTQAPTADAGSPDAEAIRPYLAVDDALYEMARARFWAAYSAMLQEIRPGGDPFGGTGSAAVPLDVVQTWLRARYEALVAGRDAGDSAGAHLGADEPLTGEGWWWRQSPKVSYRWSGPEPFSTILLPPLAGERHYELTVEAVAAADWETWEAAGLEVNGHPVPTLHERSGPSERGLPALRLYGRIDPAMTAGRQVTRIALRVRSTKQALTHVRVRESFDTYNLDERRVGIAVHRVRIDEVPPPVAPRWRV